ncbi:hypothetical protein [Parabacteroides sp. FAFU027]|uniref:hypothetical protein n=1 Tax=Parabacteroides sp. FAFU027 TaxID=2922715 RepID=UPI001FAE98EB|nr:hypothetical protein [Parabacteroides sp. FAFU027]
MRRIFQFIIPILFIGIFSCSLSRYERKDREFSMSLKESKVHKTYIKAYSVKVRTNSDSLKMTIDNAWLEKLCFYKSEVFDSSDSLYKTLLLDIRLDNKFFYNSDNYGDNWIMKLGDSCFVDNLRDLYGVVGLSKETSDRNIVVGIYKLDPDGDLNHGLKVIGVINLKQR